MYLIKYRGKEGNADYFTDVRSYIAASSPEKAKEFLLAREARLHTEKNRLRMPPLKEIEILSIEKFLY